MLVNKFSKVARYRINTQKSVVFLYTMNSPKSSEQSKKEIKKIIPLTMASKRITYFGINLTK